jgi:hypothetical protein
LFTDFGIKGGGCPGHEEHQHIIDALSARRKYRVLKDPSQLRRRAVRTPSQRQWNRLWQGFIKAKPSDHMRDEFLKMNHRKA